MERTRRRFISQSGAAAAASVAALTTGGVSIAPQPARLYATVDELKQLRELPEKHGVTVDLLTPPNLASSHIDRERNPGLMLG